MYDLTNSNFNGEENELLSYIMSDSSDLNQTASGQRLLASLTDEVLLEYRNLEIPEDTVTDPEVTENFARRGAPLCGLLEDGTVVCSENTSAEARRRYVAEKMLAEIHKICTLARWQRSFPQLTSLGKID